jgi:transposase
VADDAAPTITAMELHAALSELKIARSENEILSDRVTRLEVQLEKALRLLRGNRTEKINPDELLEVCLEFFTEEELELTRDEPDTSDEDEEEEPKPKKKRKPRGIPASIERNEEIEVLLSEEDKQCPSCCEVMKRIGFRNVEKLGFQPATFYAQGYALEKVACGCGQGIATASLPKQPIERGLALPDLLAYVIVAKYHDAIPFYRLSKMLARCGLEIGDTTFVEWSRQVADRLEPLVYLMSKQILSSGNVQADETGLPVQAKGGCDRAYLWAYGQPSGQVVYDFRNGRSREGPNEFLEGYRGNLQTDGYAGYNEVARSRDVMHFCCWAHARRKFKEAQPTAKARAAKILKLIQCLYAVEKTARGAGMSSDERRELRQKKARPVLQAIHSNLINLQRDGKFLPKSPIGEAVQYALNRWDKLELYVDYGEVEIDNNLIENAMRGIAIGRKNYMFVGSEETGRKTAVLYSIIESCKRLRINTLKYLTNVLTVLPTTSQSDLENLTPAKWHERQAAVAKG